MEELEISKLKIAIIYGKKLVDGKSKEGIMTRIYKDPEGDTAHFFYFKEFFKTNFKDEPALQNAASTNTILYELARLGHLGFTETTSPHYEKECMIFMPDNITEKQKDTLSILAKQLEKEKYTVTALSELHRNEENIIVGKQKIGSSAVLNHFLKQKSVDEPEQ